MLRYNHHINIFALRFSSSLRSHKFFLLKYFSLVRTDEKEKKNYKGPERRAKITFFFSLYTTAAYHFKVF